MKVYKDLTDFISNLNQCGVRYLLVGGYAVQLHGLPQIYAGYGYMGGQNF